MDTPWILHGYSMKKPCGSHAEAMKGPVRLSAFSGEHACTFELLELDFFLARFPLYAFSFPLKTPITAYN